MGVLEKAAQAKPDSEGKDSRDKRETHKEEMPKKHKHPKAEAAKPSESVDAEEGGQEGAEDSSPDTQDDNAPDQDDSGGAGAVSEQPDQPADDESQSGGADQGGGDADQSQGGAQGGPAPVPSPAAPGAGDTTSGGDDTPDQDQGQGQDQDPNAQPPETPGEDTAAGPGSNSDLQQVPMPPGLKEEYARANDLLMQLLYNSADDKLAMGLVQGLQSQGPGKIKNAIMLSVTVLTQLHKKINLSAPIMLPFAKDVVAHVLDLGQQVKQIQYSDQECTAILGAVYESSLRIFGVNHGNVKHMAHIFGRTALQKHQANYQAMRAHAKPAIDSANAGWHNPHLAQGDQGAPTQPGPQAGGPAGAAPQSPQVNAPPQPPVPPGPPSQGGMLSQAAAAQNPAGGQ
jgi:hypothetical protein